MLTKGKQSTSPAMTFLPKSSLAKQALTFQSKLGYNKIYDRKNKRYIQLPKNFIAQPVVPDVYIGGTMDGNVYLEISAVSENINVIPEKYCHDDAGLLLSAKKSEEALTQESIGRYFEGKLHQESVSAFLVLIKLSGGVNYLLTLASKIDYPDLDLKLLALNAVREIVNYD